MASSGRKTEVVSQTRIARDPEDVYRFVTTPANWVGTHPVTLAVEGAGGGSEGLGASWTELIKSPLLGRVVARWEVTEANPPHSWTIRTENFARTGTTIIINYKFVADNQGTLFQRNMVNLLPKGPLGLILAWLSRRGRMHDEYLAAIKRRLEQ